MTDTAVEAKLKYWEETPQALSILEDGWDATLVSANDTLTVDTMGIAELTAYISVDGAAVITLDSVSQNNDSYRTVSETVKTFTVAGSDTIDLYTVIDAKWLRYRFLRFKCSTTVTITLELSGKPINTTGVKEAKEPTIYNKTLTLANTEYSQVLPDHTKKLTFQCRTAFDIRFAFVTGKVATPTAPYMTIKANGAYDEKDLDLVGKTLYLACGNAAKVVEILVYT